MDQVVLKLGVYFLTLILAYVMKRMGIFKKEDSVAVTKLIMNVGLPATAIGAFANLSRDFSMLLLVVLGFTASFFPWLVGAFASRRKDNTTRALYLCNCPTLNLGAFAMPFLQLMLPASAIAGICLFDIGNAIVIHGTTAPMTIAHLRTGGQKQGFGKTVKRMFSSVAFCTYILMLILFLLNIQFPKVVYTVLGNFSAPNGFLVMFNLGLLLEFNFSGSQVKEVLGVFAIRMACSAAFAALFYFVLPFSLDIRRGLVMAAFAPTAATCPYFTGLCGGNESQSSLCVTICEVVSGLCLVALIFIL